MKKIFGFILIISAVSGALLIYAKINSKADAFRQADDFPRGALFYVQTHDLPALIKLWNDSAVRQKYLAGANFDEFQNRHLALKLAERASEINDALGIFPDLGFAAGLSENQAAIAVYDIGRMEFVFIAPLSEEKALASSIFQIRAGFEEIRLDDGTTVFTKEIKIDRERQNQKILFAEFHGRLILATSEKYFLAALENIKGKTPANRLTADPLFKQLADRTKPHLATIWLNQQKLNRDWYFEHYWLMSETVDLKNLRAGMIDLERTDERLIESRVYLTAENQPLQNIKAETVSSLSGLVPDSCSFYKVETAQNVDFSELVFGTLFETSARTNRAAASLSKPEYYFRDWEKSDSYSHLDEDFSEQVDRSEDEISNSENAPATSGRVKKIIEAAKPSASLVLFSPEIAKAPLFFENRRALVISLQNPQSLDKSELEKALADTARKHYTVDNQNGSLAWTDFPSGNAATRQMIMPSLGWKIVYAMRRNVLILSNSEDLLAEILHTQTHSPAIPEAFHKFTVINLGQASGTFREIFDVLKQQADENNNVDSFFTENVGSLLDAVSEVERIEVSESSAPGFLHERIDFVFTSSTGEKQ